MLARIVAPHFIAGIILKEDRVVQAAPIVSYMINWSRNRVINYCRSKSWTVSVVNESA